MILFGATLEIFQTLQPSLGHVAFKFVWMQLMILYFLGQIQSHNGDINNYCSRVEFLLHIIAIFR